MYLDERLRLAADFVRPGAAVADIGTDHGYLVCHLVATRKCPTAFACDIAPGPLARARQTIKTAGLENKITTVLCDGLAGVKPHAVDDIVIAGMGGDTIASIMEGWAGKTNKDKRFILQPMTKPEHLRQRLCEMGFLLEKEDAAQCSGRAYVVMAARYTGIKTKASLLFSYMGLFGEKEFWDNAAVSYLKGVYALCAKKALGFAAGGNEAEAGEYRSIARQMRERLMRYLPELC